MTHRRSRQQAQLQGQTGGFPPTSNGAPLERSLQVLIRTVSQYTQGKARAAFYAVDPDHNCLRPINVVDGMPEAYQRAVDGFSIGPQSLACGLAVYTGLPVLTPDVRREPRWQPWRPLAQQFNYCGCWSFPIRSLTGHVLGTFAMYYRNPRRATPQELLLAEVVTQAAAIIMVQHRELQQHRDALRESVARWRVITGDLEVLVSDQTRELEESHRRVRTLTAELHSVERNWQRLARARQKPWHANGLEEIVGDLKDAENGHVIDNAMQALRSSARLLKQIETLEYVGRYQRTRL